MMGSMHISPRLPRVLLALALAAALAAPGTVAAGRREPIVAAFGPLSGIVIALDPGHNGGNAAHAAEIRKPVWIGNGYKPCNQVGTSTLSGYPEHAFNFDVALRVKASLEFYGASVYMTQDHRHGLRTVRRRPRPVRREGKAPTWR